jgi:branched-chain amino acid transport system substrate-binding protein
MHFLKQKILFAAALSGISFAAHGETVKVAYIDSMSGPFAQVGTNIFRSFQAVSELANREKWAGEHTIEVVPFDNKGSPQESLGVLKAVIDQGFRYITQGGGSGVALALQDALNKHNERNPGKEIVYINYGSQDPDMTNSKCSFWHFRVDANSDMKMEAVTSYIAKDEKIKRVYLLNQNYAYGHSIARAAKEYLKRKRSDIQIVGEDLHPIGQVKDFSPYIAKMKAAGADAVITGNWGPDLALLFKAASEQGFNPQFFTTNAGTSGVPTVLGSREYPVRNIGYWYANNPGFSGKEVVESFKKKHNDDYYAMGSYTTIALLAQGMKAAKSTDSVKVAFAMEGLKFKNLNGDVEMRKSDHQLQQTLYIASWAKVNGKDVKYDSENTGYGWKIIQTVDSYVSTQPTTCQMKRPGA